MRLGLLGYLRQTSSKVWLLLMACGFASHASGQVSISLAPGSGTPGSTINLNISVNTSGTLPASLQWTMGYSTADISSVSVTAGAVATAAGKSGTCNGTGTLTCLVFGFNTTTIANGVVAVAS